MPLKDDPELQAKFWIHNLPGYAKTGLTLTKKQARDIESLVFQFLLRHSDVLSEETYRSLKKSLKDFREHYSF